MSSAPTVDFMAIVAGKAIYTVTYDSGNQNAEVLCIVYEYISSSTGDVVTYGTKAFPSGLVTPVENVSGTIEFDLVLEDTTTSSYSNTNLLFRVRVYTVTAGSLELSDFSDPIIVYQAPPTPSIKDAGYNSNQPSYYYEDDTLYVLVKATGYVISFNLGFIVLYSFTSANPQTGTIQSASDIIIPLLVNYDNESCFYLAVTDIGDVANGTTVSTQVQAVLTVDEESSEKYCLSEISAVFNAEQTTEGAPTLNPVVYDYSASTQTYTLTWTPPTGSFIPGYGVESYTINVQTSTSPWTAIAGATDLSNAVVSYVYSNNYLCSDGTISFQVVSNYSDGGVFPSNTESVNVFITSLPPSNPIIASAILESPGEASVIFQFFNPSDFGCGDVQPFQWVLMENYAETATTGSVQNVDSTEPYSVLFTIDNYDTANYYYVNIYSVTEDTNSTNDILSAPSSTGAILPTSIPVIIDIVYSAGNDELSFTIQSNNVPIGEINYMFYLNSSGTVIATYQFNKNTETFSDGTYSSNYAIVLSTLSSTISYVVITSSNNAGIGQSTFSIST
jgi:hypothetical protein